jgi:hypothetical protein
VLADGPICRRPERSRTSDPPLRRCKHGVRPHPSMSFHTWRQGKRRGPRWPGNGELWSELWSPPMGTQGASGPLLVLVSRKRRTPGSPVLTAVPARSVTTLGSDRQPVKPGRRRCTWPSKRSSGG